MTDEPCQTCNDVPEVCASVPGLRHCEKANREMTDPEDWYANYRREVEFAHFLNTQLRLHGKIKCQIVEPMPRHHADKAFYKVKLNTFEAPQ